MVEKLVDLELISLADVALDHGILTLIGLNIGLEAQTVTHMVVVALNLDSKLGLYFQSLHNLGVEFFFRRLNLSIQLIETVVLSALNLGDSILALALLALNQPFLAKCFKVFLHVLSLYLFFAEFALVPTERAISLVFEYLLVGVLLVHGYLNLCLVAEIVTPQH